MSAQRRLHFLKVTLRFGVVALLASAVQLLAIFAPLGDDDTPRRVLLLVSYLLLLLFVAANWRRAGILIIGLGLLLNFLPIAANGGLMPITPQTVERSGTLPAGVEPGEWIPDSKDVLLERLETRLYFLSDRLVWSDLPFFRAFSIGDVVIVAGLVFTLGDLFLPRLRRAVPEGRRPAPSNPS